MPITTTRTFHKFFNQFNNDEDFTANLSDFTENLAGGTIERIKVVSEIEISWGAFASQSDVWDVVFISGSEITITRSSGDFRKDGFFQGSFIHTFEGGAFRSFGTIRNIDETGKKVIIDTTNTGGISTGSYSNVSMLPIVADASNALTSLIYGFGLLGANETYNALSKVSQNPQGFYFTSLAVGGGAQAGIAKGSFNDWVTGSMTCERKANADDYTQVFEISHIFRIEPHYLDGELGNLQENILPDLYKASLKYAFDVDFRTVLSNPNKSIKATYDNTLGSVGWFNQNFNGFDNQYQIDSIEYEDSALATDSEGLQLSSKTKATITVSRIGGVIGAGQRAGVFVSYLPAQSEYQDTATTLSENYLLDSLYHNEGATAEVGTGIIKSFDSSIVSDKLVVAVEFEYLTAQQLRLTTDSGYLIAVQIADASLSSGNSNRVNLIADVNTYQKGAFIEGLFDVTAFNYLVNGNDFDNDTGAISIEEIWNEDSISVKGTFDLDLSKDSVLNSLEFVLVAFNTVTNSYFTLDSSYFINTSGAVISNGIQQIVIAQSRGYTQLFDENFNRIEVSTGARVGDLQSYSFLFGQKIRWQDWLNNPNADTVFFDNTKPKDNLNFKSSNYSGLQDYQVKMVVIGRTSGTDDLGREGNGFDTFAGGKITVKDYGISDVAYTVSNVATFDPDTLVNLNGSILSDKPTLLESRFSTGAAPSLGNKLIIHRFEKTRQLGNVLPEIEATLSIDGTDLVGQTLLDSSLFEQGVAYNFTARLFNPFQALILRTNWNTSTEGDWLPEFITTSGTVTLIVGTDVYSGSNSPVVNSSSLDGNVTEVFVIAPNDDFSLITGIVASNKKITGHIDLSLLPSNCVLNLGDTTNSNSLNNTITSIATSELGVNQLFARLFLGTDLTIKVNGGGLWLDSAENLNSLSVLNGSVTNDLSATNMNSLSVIDLSNLSHADGRFNISTNITVSTTLITNTTDLSSTTSVEFAGRTMSQYVDLGNYTMNGGLDLTNCLITGITPPFGTLTSQSNIRGNRFLSFASSLVLNAELLAGELGDLNEFIQIGSGTITGNFNSGNASLNSIALGSVVISSALIGLDFSNNGMTTVEVDAVWIELDRVAIVTGIARMLNVGGNNQTPSAVSLSARNSLILKGYLLTI
jgi:hypothetical protein